VLRQMAMTTKRNDETVRDRCHLPGVHLGRRLNKAFGLTCSPVFTEAMMTAERTATYATLIFDALASV
jgi:hypothetical protein